MNALRLAVAMLLASAGGCWLSGAAQAQSVAASAHGEIAVVWLGGDAGQRTIQASTGTPGATFTAPQAISPPSPHTAQPGVVMDDAGNVVVVWEDSFCTGGYKGNCDGHHSLGVFASVRPAGGRFGPPLRLSPLQNFEARPRLAMNRRGDWIVVMRQVAGTVLATARGAGAITSSVLGQPGLIVDGVALDAAGNATLAGSTTDRYPAAIMRGADGTVGDVSVLDSVPMNGLSLGVGRQGHAVVMWAAGGDLRFATRQPGGGFGPAMTSGLPANLVSGPIGVDDRGRTITALPPTVLAFGERYRLQAARGTVEAPFRELATISHPDRDAPGIAAHAFSGDGDAALVWHESDRASNPTLQFATATDGAAFSTPRRLTAAAGEALQSVAMAYDASGRLALAWTSRGTDRQRIFAATLLPSGTLVGPTRVAELIDPPPRASAPRGQTLRIHGDGTIRPLLRCASPGGTKCRGTVRIDVRTPGGRRVRAGSAKFVHRAGSSRRVTIRVTRAIRRAAGRRTLTATITVRTHKPTGGYVRATTGLRVRR